MSFTDTQKSQTVQQKTPCAAKESPPDLPAEPPPINKESSAVVCSDHLILKGKKKDDLKNSNKLTTRAHPDRNLLADLKARL